MNSLDSIHSHISVCICTFKRPVLLSQLLSRLQCQLTDNLFTYSVLVIDNDANQAARDIVRDWQLKSSIDIVYLCEPEKSIARARNRAFDNARGDYVAFIDDDEFPETNWLINLFKTIRSYKANAVLGPVKPHYPDNTPQWLIRSRICDRPSYRTGTLLHWNKTRTGNVLLDREMFRDVHHRFNPEYGLTGGEDIAFFRMMSKEGKVYVWCNEALVYETVTPERWRRMFYIKKNLRIGSISGERFRQRYSLIRTVYVFFKSGVFTILLTIFAPFSRLLGVPIFMKVVTKLAYNFGRIFGLIGLPIIRNRVD